MYCQKYTIYLLGILSLCFFYPQRTAASQADTFPCITIYLTDGGRNMSDAPLVEDQINQYIEPILGFHVDIEYLSGFNYDRTLIQKFLSGAEFDILYCDTLSSSVFYYREGWILPLNELIEKEAPAFSSLFTEEYLNRLQINNELYVLPSYHDQAACWGLEYNKAIAEECGLDMTKIKNYSDLTEIFETVAQKRPDIFPVAETCLPYWDPLNDELGVLMDFSSPEVTNLYATEYFETLVRQNHEWYSRGYILDLTSYSATNIDYLSSGLIFGSITAGKPDIVSQESRITGVPIGYIPLTDVFSVNDNITRGFFALNAKSIQSERAMQFLNLMYCDPTLANLMTYGIEGIHYEFKNEQRSVIGFPEGVNCTNSGYAKLLNWQYPSQLLTLPWEGDPPDVWERLQKFNESSARSVALGFFFDSSAVSVQMEACSAAQATYRNALIQGQLSPDLYLPRFLRALKEAGIDDIIKEKQRQLDTFLKEKGV